MPNDILSEEDDRDSTPLGGCLDELSGQVNSLLDDFRSRAGTLSKALERTRQQVQSFELIEPSSPGEDLRKLATLAREVECTSDQNNLLDLLMTGTTAFAPRAALFVVRSDSFSGWAGRGVDVAEPRTIKIPGTADTILNQALSRFEPIREAKDARPGNQDLLQMLGSAAPQEMAAAPIWVKDKVVGILYADSGQDGSPWSPEGIFLTATLVALGLEALPLRARNPRPLPPEPEQAEKEEPPFLASDDVEEPVDDVEVIEIVDPAETTAAAPRSAAEETMPDAASDIESEVIEPEPDLIGLDDELPIMDMAPEPIEPLTEMVAEKAVASQTVEMSTAQPSPEAETNDPMHSEAKRFARLLVSEILLYNEKQIQEGRLKKDLYERLREDIERSRQMYDERIVTRLPDAARYFREELINSIADGDESAMKLPWG